MTPPSDFGNILKNLAGLVGAVLAWLESLATLLPINPVYRIDLLPASSVLAVVFGFAAYQRAKRKPHSLVGVAALVLVFLALIVMIAGGNNLLNTLPAGFVSLAVRLSYVVFFSAIGAAVGRFVAYRTERERRKLASGPLPFRSRRCRCQETSSRER